MADPYAPQIHSSTSPSSPPPYASSSSASSSTATVASTVDPYFPAGYLTTPATPGSTNSNSDIRPTTIDSNTTQSTPSDDAIEAAIRAAINSFAPSGSPSIGGSGKLSTSDGRSIPPRDTRTQLYVGNLPYRVRWQDLKDLFRRAGTVLRADVSLGADNRSRGYGTVLLATAEDAGRAIDMFNGYEWQTRMLEVRVDRVGGPLEPGMVFQPQAMGGVQMINTGMYMGQQPQQQTFIASTLQPSFNIQSQVTGQQQQIYAPQPQAVSISQLQAHPQGQSQFEQLQQQYQGQQPQPQQNPPSIPGRTLFVGNLPYHVQWQDLKDLFRRTPGGATVLRADVALGPDGRSKGFGTVTLRTEEEAERAKRWFSGYEFNGRQLKVHHDRIPVSVPSGSSHSPMPSNSPANASYSSTTSPSLLSQHMLSLSDALGSVHYSPRSISSSPNISSPSSQQHSLFQSSRLRSENLLSQSPLSSSISISPNTRISANLNSLSSPLLRQIKAYQHEQAQGMNQPSPLHSSISFDARRTNSQLAAGLPQARPHSSSIGSSSDFPLTSESPPSVDIPPNQQSSPSVTRANRPTHIALPAPSFHFDFDPSIASLELDADEAGREGDKELIRDSDHGRSVSRGSGNEMQLESTIQQTTPLQMHFRQYLQRERADREQAGQGELDTLTEYPPGQFQQQNQLYQLLHGSRQSSRLGAAAPKGNSSSRHQERYSDTPRNLTHSKSLTTSLVASAASSTASLFEGYEGSFNFSHLGGHGLRGGLASGASSAAASSRSLPLALGGLSLSSSSSRSAITREMSPDKVGAARPLSTTGSTTSASESGLSTSLSGSSRTGSSAPTGHRGQEVENGNDRQHPSSHSGSPSRQERNSHPHHPGSITLPLPPQVVFPSPNTSQSAIASTSKIYEASEAKVWKGMFQQHHPFSSTDWRQTGDSAEFEYSGAPTLQARQHAGTDNGHGSQQRRGAKEAARNQEVQQWNDAQAYRQQAAAPFGQPTMMQLTPHGLPPMTPSMPPFTFVNSPPAFHSPGVYSNLPMSVGGASHFQQRHQRGPQPVNAARARQHPNAPGTLSLPPQQLVFIPGHQQSPMLSPTSTIVPGSAQMQHAPYLHPLGSPGSPYALGPHHPLHHAQQQLHYQPNPYGHMPHPLSHSFGSAGAAGVPAGSPGMVAMSPGAAPWDMIGQMPPYHDQAVGAPILLEGDGNGHGSQQQGQSRSAVGYWVYGGSQEMGGVEPKGYFDQLYMGSSEPIHDSDVGKLEESGGGDRAEGRPSVVEREILKDKGRLEESVEEEDDQEDEGKSQSPARPPFLESRSSGSTKSSNADRSLWRSASVGSVETAATTEDERELEHPSHDDFLLKLDVDGNSPPTLQHANTDPGTHHEDELKTATVARSTGVGLPAVVSYSPKNRV